MADGQFNVSKGKAAAWIESDNTKLVVLLLKAAEADATLEDYDDIDALLTAAGNTEADFTNYARKSTTDTDATQTVDDANDRNNMDMPDLTWSSAGGASNNTLVKLIVAYNNGSGDANLIPISHHDFATTTDGSDIVASISDFLRAT